MQRRYFLFGGVLLLATVSILLPTAAKAGGARAVSALKARPPTAGPATVVPGGLRLSLATRMRDPAVPPQAAAALPMAVAPTPAAPMAAESMPPTAPFGPVRQNPYLPPLAQAGPAPALFAPLQVAPAEKPQTDNRPGLGSLIASLVPSIPLLPESGQSILPSIRKVYPTGEKPLVVVSFKCPTEVLGVTPPTIKLLHNLVDMGMEGLNRADLLSFNLQQVCQ